MKLTPTLSCHDRIRNYFLTNEALYWDIPDPTIKELAEDYEEAAKSKSIHNSKWLSDFEKAFEKYFPARRKWKIKYIDEIYQVGVVATEDINYKEVLHDFQPIFCQSIKTSQRKRRERYDSSLLLRNVAINGKQKALICRLRGPVAFLNHACSERAHFNICSAGDWKTFCATRKIRAGEQLLTDYYGWAPTEDEEKVEESESELPCLFCLAEDQATESRMEEENEEWEP